MEKRKRKTVRTNRAVSVEEQETLEVINGIPIEQVMNEFIQAKQAERSAPRTIRDYQTHFRYLRLWLDKFHPQVVLHQITPAMLREYVNWMTSGKEQYDDHPQERKKRGVVGLSPMTVNVRIRTMRAFFNWCSREGYVQRSPATDIKLQKVDEDKISSFTEEQLRNLFRVPDRNIFNEFRDYVIMVILADTGLRISELLSLKVVDVDFEQLTLTVPWEKAKTRKTRTVPISKKVGKLLFELIKENQDFEPSPQHLFYSAYGRLLQPDAFDERLKIYGAHAGIDGVRCSAHTFRHTFAIHWIKAGGDPFSLQKILGHTDMSMVRKYVRLSDTDVKAKHMQFSPIQGMRL